MAIAIITGASSGLGRRFATEIQKTGEVDGFWLVARRRDRLAALAEELGAGAVVVEADLATGEGIETVRRMLADRQPQVRYLINAAGYGVFGDFSQVSDEDVTGMIDLNVKATVLLSHMVLPYMVAGANLLEIGSASAFTPLPGFNVYASTKAFVYHYAQALAYEVRDREVAVTVFCPGWVETEFLGRAENDRSAGPREKKPLLKADYAVACAMRAMRKRRLLCTCNWYTKLQHLLSKLLPNAIPIAVWRAMCRK